MAVATSLPRLTLTSLHSLHPHQPHILMLSAGTNTLCLSLKRKKKVLQSATLNHSFLQLRRKMDCGMVWTSTAR